MLVLVQDAAESVASSHVQVDDVGVLGADFAAMPEHERLARIDDNGVLGRVAPEHKSPGNRARTAVPSACRDGRFHARRLFRVI